MPLAKAGTFAQPSGKRLVARNLSYARRSVAVRVEVIRISGGRRERRGDVLAVDVVYRVVALVYATTGFGSSTRVGTGSGARRSRWCGGRRRGSCGGSGGARGRAWPFFWGLEEGACPF